MQCIGRQVCGPGGELLYRGIKARVGIYKVWRPAKAFIHTIASTAPGSQLVAPCTLPAVFNVPRRFESAGRDILGLPPLCGTCHTAAWQGHLYGSLLNTTRATLPEPDVIGYGTVANYATHSCFSPSSTSERL